MKHKMKIKSKWILALFCFLLIAGWGYDKYKEECGVRSERYDAYYDKETGIWLEEACEGKDCPFCKDRPERLDLTKATTKGVQDESEKRKNKT